MKSPRKTAMWHLQAFSVREKFVSTVLAFLAMVLVGLVSLKTLGEQGLPYMVASMGASSVLLFAVPHSPLSQPWPLVGGHLISTFVGVTCLLYIPEPVLAMAAAVSLAIAGMQIGRCLHPPGGAVALATVLGGQQVAAMGYMFVIFPVLVNTMVMLVAAWILNNSAPGRRYTVKSRTHQEEGNGWSELGYGLSGKDFHSAVSSLDEFVDVSEEQLNKLYKATVIQMRKRQIGDIRCSEIMSSGVVTVDEKTSVWQVWHDLQNRSIKAVPVVNHQKRLMGIVTQWDLARLFMKRISLRHDLQSVEQNMKDLQQTPVGLIMTAPVIAINIDSHITDALPVFIEQKINHLPVLEDNRVVVGMLTRTDLLTLLQLR